ncbi:MAG: 2-dehydropantoate 2-reductase [Acidimicrobiia bacterium]
MKESGSVAVVGAGSVGGFYGAQAWIAGNPLTLCVRTPFDHLVLESKGRTIEVSAKIHSDPAEVKRHDWVFLATKAHQTSSAAPWLETLCGPDTVIVVMQNGVEHIERVAPYAGGTEILPAVVRYGGEALAPGHVRHHTNGFLYVPDGEAALRLVELFEGSDARIHPSADFDVEAWGKLVTNVAANAIPALTEQRFPVLRRPEIAELALGLMEECVAVARAKGVDLPESLPQDEVSRMAALPDNVGSSMLYDRLAGRPLEYDALNGAVVRAGELYAVPTPLNRAMVALLGALSERLEA